MIALSLTLGAASASADTVPVLDTHRAAHPKGVFPTVIRPQLVWGHGSLADVQTAVDMNLNLVHTFPAPPREEGGWLGTLKPAELMRVWAEKLWSTQIDQLHKVGIRVIASVGSTAFQEKVFSKHGLDPEKYYARDEKGDRVLMATGTYGKDVYTSCYNNPHWRELQTQTTLALVEAGFDGIWFDYLGYYDPAVRYCQCEYCKAKWRDYAASHGLDAKTPLPVLGTGEDMTHRVNREHLQWRWRCWEEMWRPVRDAAKAKQPDFAFGQNLAVMADDTRAEGLYLQSMTDLYDYVHLEEWSHSAAPYSTVCSYLLGHAAGRGKPVMLVQNDSPPRNEIQHRIALAEAYAAGAAVQNATFPGVNTQFNAFLKRYEAFYSDTESAATVAVVASWWTKAVYEGPKERNAPYWMGQMLLNLHIPFDYLIAERDLTPKALEHYAAVILPDLAVMSLEQIDALRAYLGAGGAVLATGSTGAFDAELKPWNPDGLSRIAGQDVSGNARLRVGEGHLARIAGLPEQDYWESNPRDLAKGTDLRLPDAPPREVTQALNWVLADALPVTVQAKSSTIVLPRRKQDTLLLHLVNYNVYPDGTELTPDVNIRLDVKLPVNSQVKEVLLVSPDMTETKVLTDWQVERGLLQLAVEKVRVYSLVVVKL